VRLTFTLDLTFKAMDTLGWFILVVVVLFVLRWLWAIFNEPARYREPFDASRSAFSAEVVGESHYQANLSKLTGGKTRDGANELMTATLVLEDENPYDRNAVRVDIDGLTVGYLARDTAREWRRQGRSDQFTCPALIRGGWDRGHGDEGSFGVRLELPPDQRR
jgi:hypothetical protein